MPNPASNRSIFKSVAIAVVSLTALMGAQHRADAALTIQLNFNNANEPTSSLFGGGSMMTVVQAAADYWETAFASSTVVLSHTINVGWGPLSTPTVGQGGTAWFPNGNLINGSLTLDNDGSSTFFVDSTPLDNAEWSLFTPTVQNLGGGNMNVGRNYSNGSGAAGAHVDMLSVALHEIGHALGLLGPYPRFATARDADGDANDIDLTSPRQFPGSQIPITGSHLNLSSANMAPSIFIGQRVLLSEADILFLGQVQSFDNINLNPLPVPEPSILSFAALSGFGLLFAIKRRRS